MWSKNRPKSKRNQWLDLPEEGGGRSSCCRKIAHCKIGRQGTSYCRRVVPVTVTPGTRGAPWLASIHIDHMYILMSQSLSQSYDTVPLLGIFTVISMIYCYVYGCRRPLRHGIAPAGPDVKSKDNRMGHFVMYKPAKGNPRGCEWDWAWNDQRAIRCRSNQIVFVNCETVKTKLGVFFYIFSQVLEVKTRCFRGLNLPAERTVCLIINILEVE